MPQQNKSNDSECNDIKGLIGARFKQELIGEADALCGRRDSGNKLIEAARKLLRPHCWALSPDIGDVNSAHLPDEENLDDAGVLEIRSRWIERRDRVARELHKDLRGREHSHLVQWLLCVSDPVVMQCTWILRAREDTPDSLITDSDAELSNFLSDVLTWIHRLFSLELHHRLPDYLMPERVDVVILGDCDSENSDRKGWTTKRLLCLRSEITHAQIEGLIPPATDVRMTFFSKNDLSGDLDDRTAKLVDRIMARHLWRTRAIAMESLGSESQHSAHDEPVPHYPDAQTLELFRRLIEDSGAGTSSRPKPRSGQADFFLQRFADLENRWEPLRPSLREHWRRPARPEIAGGSGDERESPRLRTIKSMSSTVRALGAQDAGTRFFLSPISVVTGPNRAGKSAFLESIALALAGQRYAYSKDGKPTLPPVPQHYNPPVTAKMSGRECLLNVVISPTGNEANGAETSAKNAGYQDSHGDIRYRPEALIPCFAKSSQSEATESKDIKISLRTEVDSPETVEQDHKGRPWFEDRWATLDAMWLPSEWIAEFSRKAWHRGKHLYVSLGRAPYAETEYCFANHGQVLLDTERAGNYRIAYSQRLCAAVELQLAKLISPKPESIVCRPWDGSDNIEIARLVVALLVRPEGQAALFEPGQDINALFNELANLEEADINARLSKNGATCFVFLRHKLAWWLARAGERAADNQTTYLEAAMLLPPVTYPKGEPQPSLDAVQSGPGLDARLLLGVLLPFGKEEVDAGPVSKVFRLVQRRLRDDGVECRPAATDAESEHSEQTIFDLLFWHKTLREPYKGIDIEADDARFRKLEAAFDEVYRALRPFQWSWEEWRLSPGLAAEDGERNYQYNLRRDSGEELSGINMLNYGDLMTAAVAGQLLAWILNAREGSSVLALDDCLSGLDQKQGLFFMLLFGRLRRLAGCYLGSSSSDDLFTLTQPAQILLATVQDQLALEWRQHESTPMYGHLRQHYLHLAEQCKAAARENKSADGDKNGTTTSEAEALARGLKPWGIELGESTEFVLLRHEGRKWKDFQSWIEQRYLGQQGSHSNGSGESMKIDFGVLVLPSGDGKVYPKGGEWVFTHDVLDAVDLLIRLDDLSVTLAPKSTDVSAKNSSHD